MGMGRSKIKETLNNKVKVICDDFSTESSVEEQWPEFKRIVESLITQWNYIKRLHFDTTLTEMSRKKFEIPCKVSPIRVISPITLTFRLTKVSLTFVYTLST